MLRRAILSLAICLMPLPVLAQDSDRDYLTAFLEDNLSGTGRQVVITGFQGALSAQASLSELTIADDQGVWLTLRDVVLDWNRAALLRGTVSVNELYAGEIILDRLPESAPSGPVPEAQPFSLPDLPVAIRIGRLAADRIALAPGILGQPVEGRLTASLGLSGGEGAADLLLERLDDGPSGRVALTASYSNTSQTLAINLDATEGADGLLVSALGIPARPKAALTIAGKGPFSAFVADIALSTNDAPRLTGRVVTQSAAEETGFAANLSGDLAPLFLPDYAGFFGPNVSLVAQGTAHDDGRLDLSRAHLTAKALDLTGALSLAADGSPRQFSLQGRIAQPDGTPVLLPLATDLPVRLQSAELGLSYDKAMGEGWTASASLFGLDRDDLRLSAARLSGSGRIAPGQFGATLRFDAEGVQPTDAALARALGSVLSGDAILVARSNGPGLSISRLSLAGEDYSARITGAQIGRLADGLPVTGHLMASLADLSRFDALAGRPLQGAAELGLSGRIEPLSRAFDLSLQADGQDLATGQPQLDGLLRGQTRLAAKLQRDQTGLRVGEGTLVGNGVSGSLDGTLSSAASDLTAMLRLDDLAVLGAGLGGSAKAEARLTGPLDSARVVATATGQRLRSGNAEMDRLLAGESRLVADLNLQDGQLRINSASLANPELTATLTGQADGTRQVLDIQANLRNLGLLIPEFPGPLALSGSIVHAESGTDVNVTGQGPGGIQASVKGRVTGGQGDLAIAGRAQAALANAFITPRAVTGDLGFDLRLKGPLALSSLAGQITLSGGRLSDPALAFGFTGMSARADLAGGQARLTATLPLTTAGKVVVAGTIGLDAPHSAALGLALDGITLRDPDLYETQLQGGLKLTGPLLGQPLLSGQITLVKTELRVPSTGFGGAAGLPELRHVNEPAAVRATRARAGLLDGSKAAANRSGDLALDLTLTAPNQMFIRGRGLDVELAGEVRLAGSLSKLQPSGAFNLIRGRLDMLGKRLDLDEALLQLEGDLVPFLRVLASTESQDITASVLIEGRANDPKVSFTSMPELPEEEVLALLLFGRGLQNLSALQALQLANAVATLAGRGGEGVVSRLRQGFGLDNLDVKTSAEGAAELTAGKYLGQNLYSQVTVGQDGKTQIDLNLDLTDSITLRGSTATDGNTGIGVFLEKDY
ncbi:MAG: translocation/assembly module TamB domain-containing protein [Paracoccaceae bacterium]